MSLETDEDVLVTDRGVRGSNCVDSFSVSVHFFAVRVNSINYSNDSFIASIDFIAQNINSVAVNNDSIS